MRTILAILMLVLAVGPALSVNPDEILADAMLEARARSISASLRCLVCQNQSIDDSDAELARDLRVIVRERLVAGDSDQEAVQYIVDRYGEYVLLNPVVGPHTLLLWVTAPLVLLVGGVAVFVGARRRQRGPAEGAGALTDVERAALERLKQ